MARSLLSLSVSLRTRLVLLFSLLLLGVSLTLVIVLPLRTDALSRQWIEKRALTAVTVLSSAVAPGLDFDAAEQVQSQLDGLGHVPDSLFGVVYYEDGKVLAAWHPELAPPLRQSAAPRREEKAPRENTPLILETGGKLVVEVPLETANGVRGSLQTGFSLGELEREKRSNRLFIGALALGVFALGSSLAFLIGTLLVRPIRRIQKVAVNIATGQLAKAQEGLGERNKIEAESSPRRAPADEVEGLAGSFAEMLSALQGTNITLRESSHLLIKSVERLTSSNSEQVRTVNLQAEALLHAQATVEELRQTSDQAAQQAAEVLQVAAQADSVGRQGEASIVESSAGLAKIRSRVQEIAQRISELSERVSQVGEITESVREQAEQSNVLALNARIEAARAGEEGLGFAVIAQNMRALSEQSSTNTRHVKKLLSELVSSVRSTVEMTEVGVEAIEASMNEMRASSQRMGEVMGLVKGSAEAVRLIASAVREQATGIDEITRSFTELSQTMQQTLERINSTSSAVKVVEDVSKRVASAADVFRD